MTHKISHMNTQQILDQFHHERNSSKNTVYAYHQSVCLFEKYTNMKLSAFMYLVQEEQEKKIAWINQTLRQILIGYRRYLYDNYSINTAKQHLSRIIAILRHFELTIHKLPYFSTKKSKPNIPINPDLMVDREILRLCINVKNPLLKAIVLFMSSTGMSKTDTLNLTVNDYLEATSDYHKTNHLPNALHILSERKDIIGYWENFTRQKTGIVYYTFNSPESNIAISDYLMSRERLTLTDPLFDISYKYLSDLFKETNDKLGLGRNGRYSRFASHMLRRYHATQLAEAGMDTNKINLLQGRKLIGVAHNSYIKIKPSKLRDEYIEALPYLVVEDYHRVKTELDVTKEQLEETTRENIELKNNINNIWEELENVKHRQDVWEQLKKESKTQ